MIHGVLKELGPKTQSRIYGQSGHIILMDLPGPLGLRERTRISFVYLARFCGSAGARNIRIKPPSPPELRTGTKSET
jgi:hypothetical protein